VKQVVLFWQNVDLQVRLYLKKPNMNHIDLDLLLVLRNLLDANLYEHIFQDFLIILQ
jgi:hypothetical protein